MFDAGLFSSDARDAIPTPGFDGVLQSSHFHERRNPRIILNNGEVFINATHADNTANVRMLNNSTVQFELIGIETTNFSISDVDSILFVGRKGDDTFNNNTAIPSTAYGKEGNDRMFGGSGIDMLYGDSGNDSLYGRAGNDLIFGNAGNDLLNGDEGNDSLSGASGNDRVFGGNGDDFATGDAGDDIVQGGNGNDVVHGWTGADTLSGNAGLDHLLGWTGNDSLNGGIGEDILEGGAGADSLNGSNGNDRLLGGDGDDELVGGLGSDELVGGANRDSLYGDGRDSLNGGSGRDHFLYFSGDDLGNHSTDLKLKFVNKGATWNTNERRTINRALHLMHNATGNNLLVTDFVVGKPLTLEKVPTLPGGAAAVNVMTFETQNGITTYDRVIKFAEWDESNGPIDRTRELAFIHEVAHNFDNDFELAANPHTSPSNFTSFMNVALWSETKRNNNYVRSQDGEWWYHNSSQFYRSYSRFSPFEDWATVWELYFDENAARPSANSSLGRKLASITNFINQF